MQKVRKSKSPSAVDQDLVVSERWGLLSASALRVLVFVLPIIAGYAVAPSISANIVPFDPCTRYFSSSFRLIQNSNGTIKSRPINQK